MIRNIRYRRDQRQLEEEEEIWFNEDDDFPDVVPTNKPEVDSYRKCLQICKLLIMTYHVLLSAHPFHSRQKFERKKWFGEQIVNNELNKYAYIIVKFK